MLGITSRNEAGWSGKHCLERLSNAVGKMRRANKHLPGVRKAVWQRRANKSLPSVLSTDWQEGAQPFACLPQAQRHLTDLRLAKSFSIILQAPGGGTSLKMMSGVMES